MSAVAGWYTDPNAPGMLRWFDGNAWTAYTQPAPAQPAPAPATAVPAAAAVAPAAAVATAAYGGSASGVNGPPVFGGAGSTYGMANGGIGNGNFGGGGFGGGGFGGGGFTGGGSGRGGFAGTLTGAAGSIGGSSGRVSSLGSAVFLVIFGLIFAGIPLFIIHSTSIPSSLSSKATGTVTSIGHGVSSNSGTTCSPVAQFAVNGRTYEAVAPGGVASSSYCGWYPGKNVTVRFDPANPSHADIASSAAGSNPFMWLFVLVGVAVVAGGIWNGYKAIMRR